jgi:transposase
MAKRRKFTDQFKAKVALEALRGDKTVQEIAAKHQLHPIRSAHGSAKPSRAWLTYSLFSGGKQSSPTDAKVKELHAKIGRLAVANDFLSEGLEQPHLSGPIES